MRSPASVDVASEEAEGWIESLSPWPVDGFGLDRMWALLDMLGNPQRSYPAIHVVGTNGKSTATRTIEALLLADGLRVGSTISPHVSGWPERIRVDGREADFGAAIERVRAAAEKARATQFETLTAAALAEFAACRGRRRCRRGRAWWPPRRDERAPHRGRAADERGAGSHGSARRDGRGDRAGEACRRARRRNGGPPREQVPGVRVGSPDRVRWAREAAEAFAGHPIAAEVEISLPGRLERRDGEIRDGAHNPDGVRWLMEHVPAADYVVCASILRDKDAGAMLTALSAAGTRFVATQSSNARALPADDLATLAKRYFAHVEVAADPAAAVARAHELGEAVLVTGSLYLLADLARHEREPAA